MRNTFLALMIFALFPNLYAQVQQAWVARANGVEDVDEFGGIIGRDAAGYLYIAGSRNGSADKEDDGFYTIKYNPLTGATIWSRINNGAGNGSAGPADMHVDAAGNVYLAGTSGPTSSGQHWFVIKYNTNGVLLWEDEYSNSNNGENASAITVDGQGNVFVTGHSYTDGSFINSITTIKYDPLGNRKWIKYYNGTDDEGAAGGRDIAVDADGNVYVAGYAKYLGTGRDLVILKYNTDGTQLSSNRYDGLLEDEPVSMVLDASANIHITARSQIQGHESDVLTLKYNSNCNIIWERLFNGSLSKSDLPFEICIDAIGNVFVAGITTVNSAGTDRDFLLLKYDPNGNKLWEKITSVNDGVSNTATGLAVDAFGNAYITGYSGPIGPRTALVDYTTVKYNPDGVQQWVQVYDGPPGFSDEGDDILVDPLGNVYVTGSSARTAEDDDIATIKYSQCNIVCPVNISVNADAGKCDAIVTFAEATTTGDCGSTITYSHASGSTFLVGTTTVTVTSTETGATCTFDITVVDNQNPVINYCPPSKSVDMSAGVCYATSDAVNAGTATATDNCSATVEGTRSDGKLLSDNYPAGNTTITWKATDPAGNSVTCTQTITVVDNQPPVITGKTSSTYVLSPPNHTMRGVTINYTATDNCALTTTVTVKSNEPVNGVGDGDTDPDYIVLNNVPGSGGQYVSQLQLRAERSAQGSGRIYTVIITATDPSGNTTVEEIDIHVAHDIKKPHSGQAFKVGSTVSFLGEFWDKPGNKHTAKWIIDESTVAKAAVTEPAGNKNGTVTGSYKFTTPGVYKLRMDVTDQNGVTHYATTAGDLEAIVVIYDPNGGYTYGGGYFNSPAGALQSNPTAIGKASYGFAMNYFKNSTYPKGETQFEFKVGSFEFNALNFEYLAINNSMAQFKGTGKIIGGQSGVAFTMTIVDGQLDGTGVDKIRMKIYNKNNGTVYYDNHPGASDAALPTQAVGANSVIVIGGGIKQSSYTNSEIPVVSLEANLITTKLEVGAFPNPHKGTFSLSVQSPTAGKMTIEYFTMTGARIQIIEQQVRAHEQIVVPNTGLKFNGTIFYKVTINGEIKTGKIIGIN